MAALYRNLLNPNRVRLALVFLLEATILTIWLDWIFTLPAASYVYIGFVTLGFAILSIDVVPLFDRQFRYIGLALFLSMYLGFWSLFDGFTVVFLSLVVTMIRSAYRGMREWREDSGQSLLTLLGMALVFGIALNQMVMTLIVSICVLVIHQWNQLRFARNAPHSQWLIGSQLFFIAVFSTMVVLLSAAVSRLQPLLDWIVLRLLEPLFNLFIFIITWLQSKRKPRPDQGDLGEDYGKIEDEVREKTEIHEPTWVQDVMDVIFVVLIIAIIAGGIYFLWKRMRKYGVNQIEVQHFYGSDNTEEKKGSLFQWFRKDRRPVSVVQDPVRSLYIEYLHIVEKVRLQRAPHLSVKEFADIVLQKYDDLHSPIQALTDAYEQRRYGGIEVKADELNILRGYLKQIDTRLVDTTN
jgi:hypothetical protein